MERYSTRLGEQWKRFLPESVVLRLAREQGYGRRSRPGMPLGFLMAVVLGFAGQRVKCLRGLWRFSGAVSGEKISGWGFQKRFTEKAAGFFLAVAVYVIEKGSVGCRRLKGCLSRFTEISALDSSVMRLHEFLRKSFPGTRTNHTKAALKLHVVMSLKKHAVEKLAITAERANDREAFAIAEWVRGRLLLFDLGYFAWKLLGAILRDGGHFLCRLKANANPRLVKAYRGVRGPKCSVGKSLKELVLQGPVVDMDVECGPPQLALRLRLVSVYDTQRKRDHFYLTNLPRSQFSPEQLAQIYRLRWQVELIFKELKSLLQADRLPSHKQATVLCLVYSAMIALSLSRLTRQLSAQWLGVELSALSPRQVTLIFGLFALPLTRAQLRGSRSDLERELLNLIQTTAAYALDPNPSRHSVPKRFLRGPN
jgi:hypothetical protein